MTDTVFQVCREGPDGAPEASGGAVKGDEDVRRDRKKRDYVMCRTIWLLQFYRVIFIIRNFVGSFSYHIRWNL